MEKLHQLFEELEFHNNNLLLDNKAIRIYLLQGLKSGETKINEGFH